MHPITGNNYVFRIDIIRYRMHTLTVTVDAEDPSWEDLQMLLAALSTGSLSAAAETLGLGQSTASRRIARLETRIGAPLLVRTPEGTRPTELAERLAPHAELIASHMADIHRIMDGEQTTVAGRVRLALPDGIASAWLAPRLSTLLERYPKLELDLVMGNAVVDLVRREADLALRFVTPAHPELLVRRLARLRLRAYVHPKLANISIDDLRVVKLLDPEGGFIETKWIRRHASRSPTLRVSNWNALFAAVRAGLGVGILSPIIAQPAGLVSLDDLPQVGYRDLLLVYHPSLRHVPRIAAVRDWLFANAPIEAKQARRSSQ